MSKSSLSALALAVALSLIVVTQVSSAVAVGDNAPDFQLAGLDGKSVKLSSFTSKPTLLVFWVSWCPHCHSEAPVLQKLHKDLGPKGMNTVGVSVDRDMDDAKGFVKEFGLTFSNAFAGTEKGTEVIENYGIRGVPTMFIMDKGGLVKARFDGETSEETLRGEFEKLGVK